MLVFTSLIRIPMPSHAWEFYKTNMFFVQLDIFDGENFYEGLGFRETSPLNSNYELLMIENRNFMINSGSFFIIMFGTAVFSLIKTGFNFVAKKYVHSNALRKIGILINSTDNSLVPGMISLYMEMYLDMMIALFMMTHAFNEVKDGETQFPLYMQDSIDIFCSLMTIKFMTIFIIFPIVIFMTLNKYMPD